MEEGNRMKRVFGTLAFLSFFWLLGLVGAIEQNMMALGTETLYMVIALALFYVFCKLAGAFDPYIPPEKEKPQTGVQSHPRQA